jgi:hypothetical protein
MEHTNGQQLQGIGDTTDDHDFLASNEICPNAIGLVFCLTTKRLINISFPTLYHRRYSRYCLYTLMPLTYIISAKNLDGWIY